MTKVYLGCNSVIASLCVFFVCLFFLHRSSHLLHQVGQTVWLATSKRSSCIYLPRARPTSTCHSPDLLIGPKDVTQVLVGQIPWCLSCLPSSRLRSLLLSYTAVQLFGTVTLFTWVLCQFPLHQQGMEVLHLSFLANRPFACETLHWV